MAMAPSRKFARWVASRIVRLTELGVAGISRKGTSSTGRFLMAIAHHRCGLERKGLIDAEYRPAWNAYLRKDHVDADELLALRMANERRGEQFVLGATPSCLVAPEVDLLTRDELGEGERPAFYEAAKGKWKWLSLPPADGVWLDDAKLRRIVSLVAARSRAVRAADKAFPWLWGVTEGE